MWFIRTLARFTWVEEVVCPLATLVIGFTLSNLILMVRKCQVNASRVDIQLTPKHRAESSTDAAKLHHDFQESILTCYTTAHFVQSSQTPWQWLTHRLIVNEADRLFESKPSDGGTFNMPARSSSAPRRLPVWFLRFRWLPKSKIPCVPFICAPLRNCIVCFQLVTITYSQSITIPAVPVITVDGSQKAPFHNI